MSEKPLLSREDLWSLEQYSTERSGFRDKVLAHKKNRKVMLGKHLQFIFEDELTIRYQIQEMLRIEKVFEADGIQDELDAYNPLIPDGRNLKCSLLIQYIDVEERGRQLKALHGIEDLLWIKVGNGKKVFAIADEDMDRSDAHKTSAVHFLRFQFSEDDIALARANSSIVLGCDHEAYTVPDLTFSADVTLSLLQDFRLRK